MYEVVEEEKEIQAFVVVVVLLRQRFFVHPGGPEIQAIFVVIVQIAEVNGAM